MCGECVFLNSSLWFGLGSADFARLGPGERQLEVGGFHWVLLRRFFAFSSPLDVIHTVLAF